MLQNSLPSPLKPEESLALLRAYKAGDEEAKEKVIEGNLRLVMYFARKFENTGVPVEDLFSVGIIGMMKAVDSFNLDKEIKFATYASRCIDNEILMFLRKQSKKIKGEISIESPITTDVDGNELTIMDITPDTKVPHFSEAFIWNDNMKEIQEALDMLKPRDKEIVSLRYFQYQTQKEVAAALNLSQSIISRIEKKILKKLKNNIEINQTKQERNEDEVARKRAQGDRTKAKELLANTLMTYKEIADETRVPLGTVSIMAPQYRDELVRKAMGAKDPIKKAEYLREAGYEKEATAILNELGMVDYKNDVAEVVVEKPKTVELPKVMVLDEPIGKTKTIPEAIEEFKADIRKELYNEIREQVLEEMAAESKAEEASYGTIQKFFTFKYKASGGRVSTQDFINEMQELLSTLDASGNEFVTFALSIDAE